MTKLVVDAGEFMKLLREKHPEIEIELIKNGAEQVATAFMRKIDADKQADKLVNDVITRVNRELNSQYTLPTAAINAIDSTVRNFIKKYNANEAESLAKAAFNEAFKKQSAALESKINDIATVIVEKKVAAVFKAAAKLR